MRKFLKGFKRLILFCIALPLAFYLMIRLTDNENVVVDAEEAVATATPAPEEEFVMPTAEVIWTYPEGYVDYSDLPEVDLSSWEFTLVNDMGSENLLREGFVPNLVTVEGFQVREGVDKPLQELLTAARSAGFNISISRAYMSYYEVAYKYNGVWSGVMDGRGVTQAEAIEITKTEHRAHAPGTDEHQLGQAVNFIDAEGNSEASSPAMQWLADHSWEYGFTLRYPLGKDKQTGWTYTANQFRYVGSIAAEYIYRKDICFEEFLNAYKKDDEF